MRTTVFFFVLQTSLLSYSYRNNENSKTVFVYLFNWPWRDIAKECTEFLGPNGFAAVQVSPPQEHVDLLESFWWSRYQVVSYKIHSNSGSEEDFRYMVEQCHSSGVDVYVDAVLNHMSGYTSGKGFAGTSFEHYHYQPFPGLNLGWDDFHHCGRNGNDDIVNYNDLFELYNCELVDLADLKTESPVVQKILSRYLNQLMSFGVRGFRIDAAKHVPVLDLKNIFTSVVGSPYIHQELFIGHGEPIPISDYLQWSDIHVFQYPFLVSRAFLTNKLSDLYSLGSDLPDSLKAVVFLENHDLQRKKEFESEIISYRTNSKLFALAQTFMLVWPYGYPMLFSSFNFSNFDEGPPVLSNKQVRSPLDASGNCVQPWLCEHRLSGVSSLVKFRNYTNSQFQVTKWWSPSSSQIAFSRGNLGFIAFNLSRSAWKDLIATDLPDGEYCNILDTQFDAFSDVCAQSITVKNGKVSLNLKSQSVIVLQSNIKYKITGRRK